MLNRHTLFALVLSAGCGAASTEPAAPVSQEATPATASRPYLLERVGDVGVVQLYADQFEALTPEEKRLAYHLYRASLAGDRIAYDQRYAHNLAIKDLFETLLTNGKASEPMRLYLKQVWIHHGIHNMRTSRKFVPEGFTFDDLARAAVGLATAEQLEALRRPIFDETFEAMCTSKSPGEGEDILSASYNTFYPGLRLADLEGFEERYPLNSRVVRENGRIVEHVYRAGDESTPPGVYAEDLRGVIVHLENAMGVASENQRTYWGHLARFFRTGDPAAFREYNVLWVQDDPKVDAILGFIESYADARGAKGTWEGITYYRNDERTGAMRAVAANAPYFEARTPWDAAFRRAEFRPLVANAVDVVVENGDGGPISPAGINLPNEQAIREQHGSRNFFLYNVIDAGNHALGEVAIREFAPSESAAQQAVRCEDSVWDTMVALHEVTGHASGRVSEALEGDPRRHLQQYYSTLEEARADLVALWHMADPKAVEIGLLPDAACVATGYQIFASGFLASLRRYPAGVHLEEDHDRARSLIIQFARDRGAIAVDRRNDHFYLRVVDADAFRRAVGELLAELQRIKATGDFAAIAALVTRFATDIDQDWRADAAARAARLGLPNQFAYVSPRLVATELPDGSIGDVRIERPESFEALMLEWSALARSSRDLGSRLTPSAAIPTAAPPSAPQSARPSRRSRAR